MIIKTTIISQFVQVNARTHFTIYKKIMNENFDNKTTLISKGTRTSALIKCFQYIETRRSIETLSAELK